LKQKITVNGRVVGKGAHMRSGRGWTLIAPNGDAFHATCLETVNKREIRIAMFSVPKRNGAETASE
jgi:hypothetical protein